MGAINYKTSEYITIGYNCNNIDYEDEFYNEYITEDYEQIKYLLNKEYFYYWHVKIEPGYYEGFTIDISNNFPWCFDNYNEKRAALKEITEIKKFLLTCINDFGLCAAFPGWCMKYANRNETIKLLNQAIKEMRETVKTTCTWYTLPETEKIPAF